MLTYSYYYYYYYYYCCGGVAPRDATLEETASWLRTNGVNTNGAAAKVMNFDRLGKKVRPGTFGKDKRSLTGVSQKVPLPKNMKSQVTPLVLTPFVPFPQNKTAIIININISLLRLLLLPVLFAL